MSSPPPPDRAALGRARLAARARRISLIRRRVIAATLATFALAFGAIAWDGSMGSTTATTAQVSSTTTSTGTSSSGTSSSGSDDSTSSGDSSSSSSSSSSSTPDMTTTQS